MRPLPRSLSEREGGQASLTNAAFVIQHFICKDY
jgi:hypothetical protein